MKNIFVIGSQVSGKSFIGRDKYLKEFKNLYQNKKGKATKAIVGLLRIGKSSLVYNLFKKIPKNVIYINEDVGLWNKYIELWKDICRNISKYLIKNNIVNKTLKDKFALIEKKKVEWEDLVDSIKSIFQELSDLGLKVIIVLEEFDNAIKLFNSIEHWQLFRTIFSNPQYNVSAITISRRNLKSIEGDIPENSNFHGIFDNCYLKGFDDDDMQKYYNVFENMGIKLKKQQKEEIEYYCGRLPLLLSIMGHYIVDTAEHKEEINIKKIFRNKCKSINDYYKDCINQLKKENDLQRIISFVIGPRIGVNESDKEELMNLGYLQEKNGRLMAISKYFENFLSLNEINLDIWTNIITLEKTIKNLIYNELINLVDYLQVGGYTLNLIQLNILSKISDIAHGDIVRYNSFIELTERDHSQKPSYFDVMSLTDSFKIIRQCWAVFKYYFNDDTYNKWESIFDKCANARNPVAHGHEEYLSDSDINEIDKYCKQIFRLLGNIYQSPPSEESILEVAGEYNYEEPKNIYDLSKCEVKFTVESVGNNNNLLGTVIVKYYKHNIGNVICKCPATITKSSLSNLPDLYDMVGKVVNVKIYDINFQKDRYLCQYLGEN